MGIIHLPPTFFSTQVSRENTVVKNDYESCKRAIVTPTCPVTRTQTARQKAKNVCAENTLQLDQTFLRHRAVKADKSVPVSDNPFVDSLITCEKLIQAQKSDPKINKLREKVVSEQQCISICIMVC